MKIWMMVSQDKYRLPLVVADTCVELAMMTGVTPNLISSVVSKWKAGIIKNPSYISVEIEGE